jgi:CRISPR-associated protein Csx17
MTTHEHHLVGCRPEPLGSYLKALGVLRLVAEQADASATGRWTADGFVLDTTLDDESLPAFFLDSYRPTPLLSPWNNSSGFGPEGAGELHVIETSTDPRLAPYREAIAVARDLLARSADSGWSKEQLIAACRAELPDPCVPWLDAAAVLAGGRAVYPPLLGTGGNDGRLEFSRNFHQRTLDVLGISPAGGRARQAWWHDALFAVGASTGLRGRSPGQFDPGAAGGANSAATGAADSVLNPWDWVLLLEGSLLLASGSARRLASMTAGRAAAPFTVEASAVGYASALDTEKSRGEFWAPLWERPVGLPELRRLFAEARADWRQGHARSGLDLARAATSLGVERGITAFARHSFLERFGLSTVAVPAGRVAVPGRPAPAPLAELDGWLERVRRGANPPASVNSGLRSVDTAIFGVATQGSPMQVRRLLVEVARLEAAVARATAFRENAMVPPVTGLTAVRWLAVLSPQTADPELRLAVSLASGRDIATSGVSGLRLLLRPVAIDDRGRLQWTGHAARVPGLGHQPVTSVLAAAHARRATDLLRDRRHSAVVDDQVGLPTHFSAAVPTPLSDLARLVGGELGEDRLADDVAACLLLDWPAAGLSASRTDEQAWPPPSLAVLAPFFTPAAGAPAGSPRRADGEGRPPLSTMRLRPEATWPALLATDRVEPVLTAALRRLRMAGLDPVSPAVRDRAVRAEPGLGPRLAAALLCRLHNGDRIRLLDTVCPVLDPSPTPTSAGEPASDSQETPDA